MGIVRFESLDDCDLVEIELVAADGSRSELRLFVDSRFTGASSFVLSGSLREFALATLLLVRGRGADWTPAANARSVQHSRNLI